MRIGEGEARREPDVTQALDIGLNASATPTDPVGDQDPDVDPFGEPVVGCEEDAVLERPASLGIGDGLGAAVRRVEVRAQRAETDRQRPRVKVPLLPEAPDRELAGPSGSADAGVGRPCGEKARQGEDCQGRRDPERHVNSDQSDSCRRVSRAQCRLSGIVGWLLFSAASSPSGLTVALKPVPDTAATIASGSV